ncbi:hypothetical protein H6P81_001671 [Aristolochia fimbriata]|uniref:Uncharacterized protein n=1 Tax=Aristolochia fimbriata TaxID=158543 RepID=A0AAV7F7U1_ARIFI|nr:hypothetical protein H6P81_001671 [Aristolochia fimbriata]
MDREPEELQFMGFFGICNEAHKIILSWRRIFTQITLSLILPLSFVFLAHIQISDLIFTKITINEEALETTQMGSPSQDKILDRLSSEWTAFLLFKAAYLICVLVFALLSTSAVVYTIACIYTAKDLTYPKVISVVPKVWKRLMVTFLWNFIILLCYNTLAVTVIVLTLLLAGTGPAGALLLFFLAIAYGVGLVYISVVWHLASVVSVLEDVYGIQAMQKSKVLIRGKVGMACSIFLLINLALMAVNLLFARFVVHGSSLGVLPRITLGILFVFALSLLILVGLVMQTVIYFVCKSYHHENVDKSCLADHLEVYLGEYEPLKDRSVQLEQLYLKALKHTNLRKGNRTKVKFRNVSCTEKILPENSNKKIDLYVYVGDSDHLLEEI